MSNPFAGDFSTGPEGNTFTYSEPALEAVKPPLWILATAAIEVAFIAFAFVPSTKIWHWIGYIAGTLAVAGTVSAYRSIDRTRQRSSMYGSPSWIRGVPTSVLLVGIALSATHAFYLAITRRLA